MIQNQEKEKLANKELLLFEDHEHPEENQKAKNYCISQINSIENCLSFHSNAYEIIDYSNKLYGKHIDTKIDLTVKSSEMGKDVKY